MRSESEDQFSLALSKSDDDTPELQKKPKISYTRGLLLSLSELDICRMLPSGLDQSNLGGFGTCSTGLSHFCHNSDSGKSHGYLSQHSHPNLARVPLGNGASPHASSCVSGASAPLVQCSGFNLLKRSNSAYRPPHLCKAKVHSRADSEDFCNNETFGSSEHLSQDRTEEERRRRDSFELMRKKQHISFQGNQNKISDEQKENLDPEAVLLLEASGNCKRRINRENESEECATSQSEASDPARREFTAQIFASAFPLPSVSESRPLEMNVGKSLTGTFVSESCDTKGDHSKDSGLHSSGLARQFLGEKKSGGGISPGCVEGIFEVCTARNEEITWQNSIKRSSERNELAQSLMGSTTSTATDESSEQLHNCTGKTVTPGVLSCDNFELFMPLDLNEHDWHPNSDVQNLSLRNCNKLNVTSGVLSCDDFELSMLPDLDKQFWHLYGLDQTNVEASSKLNGGFGHKLCASEIEVNGFSEDLQTTEFSGTQRESVGMITENDVLKTNGIPFLDGGNGYIIPSTVDASGSIKINCEGIMSSSCTKQTLASKTEESLSISSDSQAKKGLNLTSDPECDLSPHSCFYEDADPLDEICLPDEDSLITVEDCILPRDSTSIAAGCFFRTNLLTSSSHVDIADKLAAVNPFLIDETSTQLGLEGPIFDSYDIMGLKTSYANPHAQQSHPQFGHFQMNPGRPIFKSSDVQHIQMSSETRTENHLCNPHLLHFPTNVRADHFRQPHADPRRFGHPINGQLQQHIPSPNKFSSPHQVHRLPRGSSSHPINEMAYYAQELHPPQYLPFHNQQQNYGGLGMPIPGPADGIANQAADMRFEMDKIKADASFSNGWPWFKNL